VNDPYAEVKALDPDVQRRVVEIASIVTCAPRPADRYEVAAKVEKAVMALARDLLRRAQ
jgi:hypothetical protein